MLCSIIVKTAMLLTDVVQLFIGLVVNNYYLLLFQRIIYQPIQHPSSTFR